MVENNQFSDETKPEATDSSSAQPGSQAVDMNHTNAIVPHQISNHDKLVQTMVMVDGEWVNVNDTNDQANMKDDMNKVNKKVVEAQKGIVEAKSAADSAAKAADSAVSASVVNSNAITAQSAAISEAKSAISSATAEIQQTAANAASDAAKIRADVAQVQNEVDTAKAANSASVEALKSDVSAAKQDIQAARQANENVAKQLDDYTKQAQAQGKTIKDIQDAQDGYTATLADVKGNVSKISDAVDGLSASLKDDQDNVATIKAKADELSATLTDHDKNIAQLTASAKELSSTLEDADGRLSKVEQTASTLTNEFSDQQGRLSKVEQTASGTQQTVANQQGQINDIKTDAAGIHETLTGQGNQIANINVTLNGLNTKYEGVSGDLNNLSNRITTNSTQIAQNQQAIALKADQSTMTNLTGEVSQAQAQLKVQAGQIGSKVSSTDFKTLNDRFNNMKVGGRNLLHDTSDQWRTLTGSGWFNSSTASDVYTSVADYHDGDQFTYSAIITNPSAVPVRLVLYCYDAGKQRKIKTALGPIVSPGAGAKAVSVTITTDWRTWFLRSNIETVDGEAPQISIQAKDEKLEAGNTATAWTPNPDDLITSIGKNSTAIDQTNKQISLKADQTEVDQIKNTASHNSSRLNVMANEISSKVTSTDVNNIVDSKGYATTSTVQSLITQKASTINESITNLTSKFNSLQVGGTNVLKGTDPDSLSDTFSDHTWKVDSGGDGHGTILELDSEFSAKHGFKIFGNTGGNKDFTQQPMHWNGGEYVFTVYIRLPPEAEQASVTALIRAWNNTKGRASYQNAIAITSKEWHKFSMKIDSSSFYEDDCGLSFGLTGVGSLDFAEPMLVTGSVASDWTPAPSDNATVTQVQQITASIDGLQSTVANKADESQITQLSNVIQSKVNSSDYNSKVSQLSNDINLRVTKGDLISQINLEAGGDGLISVQNGKGKLMLDADSVVFGNKAFIPSAAITNIQADQITSGTLNAGNIRVINLTADSIHGGTLDVGNMHVKNFSANDIEAGTLSGITIRAGDTTDFFQTSQDNIYWITDNGDQSAVLGKGTYDDFPGFNIFDSRAISLGTYAGSYLQNGTIEDNGGSLGHPKFNIERPADSAFDLDSKLGEMGAPLDNNRISGWVGQNEYFHLERNIGFFVRLNQDNNASQFRIQKDDHFGAYFGEGNNGNQIDLVCGGAGASVNVTGDFHATGSKNSIVNTKQGYLAINAYETAEYYFGDIGEDNTGNAGQVVIGIDRIFNETVNTDIQYQVFVTPYSDAHVWVKERYNNRFVVCSDKPNAEFGWELKAKRKGYESNRLRRVSVDVNPLQLKGETK